MGNNASVFNVGGVDYAPKDQEGRELTEKLRSDYNAVIENTFGHGLNYYNYRTVDVGYVLRIDGTVSEVETGYTSDYIVVQAETTYNKRYVFNSTQIADVVFYNADKEFISSFYHSGTTLYFTTPANCAYIRICGYTANIAAECIEKGQTFVKHEYYRSLLYPSSGGADCAYLFAQHGIVIDETNHQITTVVTTASGKIYLHIPGLAYKEFTPPVDITGSGATLYYNADTETFGMTNSDIIVEKHMYRIGNVGIPYAFGGIVPTFNECFIVSKDPILYYDFANSVLTVKIPSSVYIWENNGYNALTQETYDLAVMPDNINCVLFNLATKKFTVTNSFTANGKAEVIQMGFIFRSSVCLKIPYAVKAGKASQKGKTAVTYGDSLTWYNGNEFNWGPHQGEVCHGYQDYLDHVLGIICTNRGASGATTPDFVANKIIGDSTRIAEADYIVIMPSIMNDDRLGVSPGTVQPIGGTFDDTTTAGALQKAIEYIYSIKPDSRIVMIVEPQGFTYVGNNYPKLCNELLAIAIRNVAKLYGIPFIDLWEKSGINALTRNTYYADPSFESGNTLYMYHPNNFGWEVISRIICEEMKAY